MAESGRDSYQECRLLCVPRTEEDEQNLGGKFEVDVDLYCDVSAAAESDSLKKTVDYEKVYAVISEVGAGRKYRLLEAFAHDHWQGDHQGLLQCRARR